MLKPGQLYFKTMPFVWAKLLLALATVVISAVIFAILMGIAWLFKSPHLALLMFFIWLGATKLVNFVLNHYLGYLVKAGHVAVITEAVVTGNVPDNQVSYGKEMVKQRFGTSNVYFVLDKLVSGAVRQLQKAMEKVVGGLMGGVQGIGGVMAILKMFIGIALGYIDECCLGYTFYKKEQGAFKSAADGVVIYTQNWKKLLKSAALTTVTVIILLVIITLVSWGFFALLSLPFRGKEYYSYVVAVAFLLACFVAAVIKSAFIDSYVLVKMIVAYMQEAPTTQISFDLYGKLCGWSTKFKELFTKGQQEDPTSQPALAAAGAAGTVQSAPVSDAPASEDKPIFCGNCGAKNTRGTKFCGSCGSPMA
jgi:ABC-type sugar transport system permease subunit